jgi:large subunit ribosomal protein L4
MALASKIADNQVVLIDKLAFEQPKTKEAATILKNLKLGENRLMVAIERHDPNVYLSIRNMANVSVSPVMDLNALSVLHPQKLLMTTAALDAFRAKAAGKKNS